MDDTIQQPSTLSVEKSTDLPTGQNSSEQSLSKKHRLVKWLLILLPIVIISIAGIYFFSISKQEKLPSNNLTTSDKSSTKKTISEVATRTYYKNGQPIAVLEEKSKRNSDGSLETVVTSNNKKLSHHLYTKDLIVGLSNGVLNLQELKSGTKQVTNYLTTGENILKYVSKTPNLSKTTTTLNGKKTIVYTIGGKKSTSFEFIKSAFAQTDDGSLVKVYVDDSTGVLKKVEQMPTGGVQPQEVIDYSEGPFLPPLPITNLPEGRPDQSSSLSPIPITDQNPPTTQPEDIVNQLPQLSLNDQLKLIEEKLKKNLEAQGSQLPEGPKEPPVLVSMKEIAEETKEIKAVSIQPAVVPEGAIYLNPLSIIPTPSGYNSPIILLSSTVFNQQTRVDKAIKENGVFNNEQFAKNNVKVRIDGTEVNNEGTGLGPELNGSTNSPWTVSLLIPKGLTPGYHTIEVFMIDSWYLAPSLLVTLPQVGEKVLEIDLSINPPPVAVVLPNNQGYRVTLRGKNFIKPFTISLDSMVLDDSAVQVNGTEELILTIPANISPPSRGPAYDIVITKGSQKVFRPALLILGGPGTPP